VPSGVRGTGELGGVGVRRTGEIGGVGVRGTGEIGRVGSRRLLDRCGISPISDNDVELSIGLDGASV